MSITLDVNSFLNKDVCPNVCDDAVMEKEMETNIFDEIEHLLKFNKDLEYKSLQKAEEECKKKKVEETKQKEMVNLDFFNTHSDDFLLTSDSQSLLGEDALLFTVEQDRLQPISSRFMVPGIYKRIEGVATGEVKSECRQCNVYISELERNGRIVRQRDFERLYVLAGECEAPPLKRVLLLESLEGEDMDDEKEEMEKVDNSRRLYEGNSKKEHIPKEWDALNRLAYDILKLTNRDHIVIDRKRNEIVRTQYNTQQKTIYRFLAPELMGLQPNPECANKVIDVDQEDKFTNSQLFANKLGRPKKRCPEGGENATKASKKLNKKEKEPKIVSEEKKTITKNHTTVRTRSGRIIKTTTTATDNNILLPPPSPPQENIKNLLSELQDGDYKNSKLNFNKTAKSELDLTAETSNKIPTDSALQSPLKRKVPPEAICPTCKKIFLGRRLQRHFTQHPEHMKINNTNLITSAADSNTITSPPHLIEDMSLFRFLISKLQKCQTLNEDQKADLFLNELNDLIEQLQLRSSRLIRNTSGLHFVNQRCSKLLGIPEGQYALDISAIEAPLDPELTESSSTQNNHTQPSNINTRSLDYTNLSITLDETLTDEAAQKLNLSAGGKLLPPSEESLLRAVGDLVQTDINKMHATAMLQQQPANNTNSLTALANSTAVVAKILPPHIDHASDNAVEASHMKETSTTITAAESPLMNLSVDFFQFNN